MCVSLEIEGEKERKRDRESERDTENMLRFVDLLSDLDQANSWFRHHQSQPGVSLSHLNKLTNIFF